MTPNPLTLKIETDSGTQPLGGTGTPLPGLGATRQGAGGRSLEVTTTQLRAG